MVLAVVVVAVFVGVVVLVVTVVVHVVVAESNQHVGQLNEIRSNIRAVLGYIFA